MFQKITQNGFGIQDISKDYLPTSKPKQASQVSSLLNFFPKTKIHVDVNDVIGKRLPIN